MVAEILTVILLLLLIFNELIDSHKRIVHFPLNDLLNPFDIVDLTQTIHLHLSDLIKHILIQLKLFLD